ncbi:hypothetical protein P7C73_g6242, partial [Tremellales sp. Uapishka_1]
MFQVPSHLPRLSDASPSTASPAPSPVMDILQPLLDETPGAGPSRHTSARIRDVREKLQDAVKQNKAQSHELVLTNFPSISAHIRLGGQVQTTFSRIERSVRDLERQIDPSDGETSFLPPVLSLISRHYTSSENRIRAESHLAAFEALSSHVERIEKLEAAIWGGRGADEWVVRELSEQGRQKGYEVIPGHEALSDTRVMRSVEAKMRLFRSLVTEQVTDAFSKAISFADPTDARHGTTLSVQNRTSLQQPRIPRPEALSSPKTSTPPPYPLSHIYAVLSQLTSLSPLLQSLRNRILRDLVRPLVESTWKIDHSRGDNLSILRLEATLSKRDPSSILSDILAILSFVTSTLFPPPPSPLPEREEFLSSLETSIFQAVLDHVLLPAMPSTLSSVPSWLNIVQQAVDFEDSTTTGRASGILKTFFEEEAGTAWGKMKRERVVEEGRRLIMGGWG